MAGDRIATPPGVAIPLADRVAVWPQYLLPKLALTRLMGRLAGAQAGAATTAVIRWFIQRYGVNMAEAAEPDPAAYPTFNQFFTRALRDGARPLAPRGLLCPVDGAISQIGAIEGGAIVQAKGHGYTAQALLGGDAALAARFEGGAFATLYLSPRDYHRIHMPAAGVLRQMVHVPGELFSVNPSTARGVPGLFARNERVVCVFEGLADDGCGGLLAGKPFVMVLVGATIVGSMATRWHGVVNPPRPGSLRCWDYSGDTAPRLARGEEMGRFLLGSTVVLLLPPLGWRFDGAWLTGDGIRMGAAMAEPAVASA